VLSINSQEILREFIFHSLLIIAKALYHVQCEYFSGLWQRCNNSGPNPCSLIVEEATANVKQAQTVVSSVDTAKGSPINTIITGQDYPKGLIVHVVV